MNLSELNRLPEPEAAGILGRCCASQAWIKAMVGFRPFASLGHLLECSGAVARQLGEPDWLEAFAGHPRIGDLESLKAKYQNTSEWTAKEQACAKDADEETLVRLAEANDAYANEFGFIFIICATGKSASEMLEALERRLGNDRETELAIAAAEQMKITRLRLEKLLNE